MYIGENWDEIKLLSKQTTLALQHLHIHGLIHGDLKPSNIIQIDNKIKLIDLDASANYFSGQYIGSKVSTGIIPPELLYKREDGRIIIKTFKFDPWTKMPVADHEGCIIYIYIYNIYMYI